MRTQSSTLAVVSSKVELYIIKDERNHQSSTVTDRHRPHVHHPDVTTVYSPHMLSAQSFTRHVYTDSEEPYDYAATQQRLVPWPLIGQLPHLVQRTDTKSRPVPPRCTKLQNSPIKDQWWIPSPYRFPSTLYQTSQLAHQGPVVDTQSTPVPFTLYQTSQLAHEEPVYQSSYDQLYGTNVGGR